MNLHNIHFPRRAVYYLLLGMATMAVIFFLTIKPAWQEMDRIETKIENTKTKIEEQKVLHPLYATLKRTMDNDVLENSSENAEQDYPEKVNVDTAVKILNLTATGSNLDIANFSPVPASVSRNEDRILFNAALTGNFGSITAFLSKLANIPFFLEYESFEVRSRPEQIQTNMEIWIAVE